MEVIDLARYFRDYVLSIIFHAWNVLDGSRRCFPDSFSQSCFYCPLSRPYATSENYWQNVPGAPHWDCWGCSIGYRAAMLPAPTAQPISISLLPRGLCLQLQWCPLASSMQRQRRPPGTKVALEPGPHHCTMHTPMANSLGDQ